MGLIYKQVHFRGAKKSKALRTLMDTGASLSLIRAAEAREIGAPLKTPIPLQLEFGKGSTKVKEILSAAVKLDKYNILWHFYVVPSLTEEAIIGADFFQHYRIKLDPKTEELIIDPRYLKAKLVRGVDVLSGI